MKTISEIYEDRFQALEARLAKLEPLTEPEEIPVTNAMLSAAIQVMGHGELLTEEYALIHRAMEGVRRDERGERRKEPEGIDVCIMCSQPLPERRKSGGQEAAPYGAAPTWRLQSVVGPCPSCGAEVTFTAQENEARK